MAVIQLKAPEGHQKPVKRRGRGPGTGLGKTSGRGHKGQKARAGGGVRPGFEGGQMPLYRRLPKRGFTPPFRKEFRLVALSRIAVAFKDGETVDSSSLIKAGLVGRKDALIKVLKDTDKFDRKVILAVHGVSATVREMVEKAGGEIRLIKAVPDGKKPAPAGKTAKNAKKS